MRPVNYLELVCPAGTPAALHAAIDAGADTRLLRLSRLHQRAQLSRAEFRRSRRCARASPTPTRADGACWSRSTPFRAPATSGRGAARSTAAAEFGADAVILADIGVLDYATRRHPGLRRHLSVQAAASNPLSIDFYRENFGVSRVVCRACWRSRKSRR